jgi:hypothetical protein
MAYIAKLTNAGGVSTVTRYVDMLAGNATFIDSSYESIATANGTGSSTTISFTSIPLTYQHLQIRFLAFTSAAMNINVRFNSDSAANYAYHQLVGDGASPSAAGVANSSVMFGGYATASQYGVGVIDLLDYANTNKNKTMRSLHGSDANGSGLVLLRSGLWQNTNAINRIDLIAGSGNFTTASSFALYGIEG